MSYTVVRVADSQIFARDPLPNDPGVALNLVIRGEGFSIGSDGMPVGGNVTSITLTLVASQGIDFDNAPVYTATGLARPLDDFATEMEPPFEGLTTAMLTSLSAAAALRQPGPVGGVWFNLDADLRIDGTTENDVIIQGAEANAWRDLPGVFAGAGDDYLTASALSSTAVRLYGQNGNDSLVGRDGSDYLNGGLDNDTIIGGAGDDLLLGNFGNDSMSGNQGDDTLRGAAGDDLLFGQDGNDRLSGGTGRDLLAGANGNDTLTGGPGPDAFVLNLLAPDDGFGFSTEPTGRTVVTDFDLSEDILWIGPSQNGTYNRALAYELFTENAEQRGANTVYNDGTSIVIIRGLELTDLTPEHFQDGAEGLSYSDWLALG
ncbi:calcium-binding protein [Thalassococcus lentus]|uniref:Calcium-binding protein n=1 Tax=Thalassococcus lentus TaxID=1210524 RepID=A0ABT4XR51_9RHOB|nr:calcium-binding protein [Thalassococcus lentus]MDA7424318.1 calcium-binding protein [Thalassococcus lentus]